MTMEELVLIILACGLSYLIGYFMGSTNDD